jgi:uncharacterized protein YdeI (YjbR/CyaY-like superfamily)
MVCARGRAWRGLLSRLEPVRLAHAVTLKEHLPLKSTGNSSDLSIFLFKNQKEWEKWLGKNHSNAAGVWLQLGKKSADLTTVSYAEALEVALCYGWIDGQKKSYDEASWLQKFTPRGAKSIWSKINREKATALIESGKMQPAGFKAIEAAKADGRWDAAYDSHSTAAVPDDLQAALNKNRKAKDFFATLNSQNRYAILFRIQTAKRAETRARRIKQFVEMLARNEKLYP